MHCIIAPLECYIMQGEHPLPAPVIEKFAKTGGALSNKVFLLRELHVYATRIFGSAQCSDKSGVLTTPHGIRIACLAGIFDSNLYTTADSAHVCLPYALVFIALTFRTGIHVSLLHHTYG